MCRIKGLLRLIIFAVLCAVLFSPMQVVQTQDLKTITAAGTITTAHGGTYALTMSFPPAGGKVTGSVYYKALAVNGSCSGTLQETLEGTFSGGDGGSATGTATGTYVPDCEHDENLEYTDSWSGNFYANGTGNGVWNYRTEWGTENILVPETGQMLWKVTFSAQEFQAALGPAITEEPTLTEEPTNGLSCSPQVRGLSPSKPGDVISPGASYFDANGQAVGIIQERWFLNGVNTNSIIWDGTQVQVELQWTCLDHTGNSRTFIIPAYQEQPAIPPAAAQPPESAPPNIPGGVGPAAIGVGAIIIGGLGAAGVAGIAISRVTGGLPKAPPPTPPNQVAPPAQPPARPEPGKQPQPPKKKLTPEDKARLLNVRSEMESEINRVKNQWRQTRNAVDKLNSLKKKNMLKFIFKKGFDVQGWMINSPVELINKVTVDPLMDKIFEKHDTSQDGNIIVAINNRVQSLKAEMQQMVDEVRYLFNEIAKINQNLSGVGK
jgi:hypothetical protein